MRRRLFLVVSACAVALATVVGWRATTTAQPSRPPDSRPDRPPAAALPITQVILFNSGVGYFQREGEVEESTRIHLTFPAGDVNDLLKSLVLQDLGGGTISSISYDSQEPMEKTLRSFGLDLTSNPTFGQILNQARGEKVEVTMQPGSGSQPGTLSGVIVGMESHPPPADKDAAAEVHMLNLLCAEGMRSVPLSQVQRVRFLNPVLEGEFRRALAVLASAHDAQKKTVSLSFTGEGKRLVRVGYVVENPIWKASYRLVLDQNGKPLLQGWAVVENTSDDDWNNVRMVLVSGRPISFQMNLYQPLYIPRPTVEPELFASLRPPAYSGALVNPAQGQPEDGDANGMQNRAIGGLGAVGGLPGFGGGFGGAGASFNRYQGAMQFGLQGGQYGNLGAQFGMAGQYGLQGGGQQGQLGNEAPRLTYEELQRRRLQQQAVKGKARAVGSQLAALDPSKGVPSVASAEEIGDHFQYVIDHKVSLPRQKSALLPVVNKNVEATKVSIFNEAVHAKFPLLGLKFKNTSGQTLMQGPVTVYEGGKYAGDGRVLDLQPNEERLLSYAIDLGTEVKAEAKSAPEQLMSVKIVKGVLRATNKLRETRTYLVKNRSGHDRLLLIEHPIRADWKLVRPAKPSERSREVYRFGLPVPAGQTAKQEVVEEQTFDRVALLASGDRTIRSFLNSRVSSPRVKEALKKAMDFRTKLADTQGQLAQRDGQLKAIEEEQVRLRANLEKLPRESAAYKRYVEKFDTQETEIEKLQKQIKEIRENEQRQQKEYEDYLSGLSVE